MKELQPYEKEEAIAIARRLKNAEEWDMDLLKDLFILIGMEDEWEEADGETFESVIEDAAEALDVEII